MKALPLALILGASLLVKVGLCLLVSREDPMRCMAPDSMGYVASAEALLKTGTFSVSPERGDMPQTVRTPGYPIFLAVIFACCGKNLAAVVLTQIVLSLLTIVLTWHVARRAFGGRVGALSALLIALDLNSLSYTNMILTETLFTLVLLAFLAIAVHLDSDQQTRRAFAALAGGLVLAVATHIRPIGYFLPLVVMVAMSALGWRRKWGVKVLVGQGLLLILPSVILVGGWQVRNHRLTGSSEFSQMVGFGALDSTGVHIVAQRDGVSLEEARKRLGLAGSTERFLSHPEEHWGERWKRQYIELIRENPWICVKVQLTGAARTLAGPGATQLLNLLGIPMGSSKTPDYCLGIVPTFYPAELARLPWAGRMIMMWAGVYLGILYFGIAVFLWMALTKRTDEKWILFLMLILVAYFLFLGGGGAYSRFRVPIAPVLAIASAVGMGWYRHRGFTGCVATQ